jgi:hypothetical protein
MNPIEPVAERGSKKLKSSAVTARPQRMSASVSIDPGAAGALRYMKYVHTTAIAETDATYQRVALRIK